MELFGVYYTYSDIGGVGDGSLTVKKNGYPSEMDCLSVLLS
jgi:hypothetical protein